MTARPVESSRVQPIDSQQNPRFKVWDALNGSRGIRKHGAFLLSGRKLVPEALSRWPARFDAMLFGPREAEAAEGLAPPPHLKLYRLERALFERLDTLGTGHPLLVGRLPDLPAADLGKPPSGLELVCALGDPNNLGAAMRSAAAFGVARLILLRDAAHPFHPRALRAAANAGFELAMAEAGGWDDLARAAGPLAALDAGGEDLAAFDWPADLRLVLGEEGLGLPASLDARRLSIPTSGAVESLNATVAAGIALHAAYTARRGARR